MEPSDIAKVDDYSHLAAYRRCIERLTKTWPAFLSRRSERLRQGLFGAPAEKVAENILEDLFTGVLDWPLSDVNLQIGHADMILSNNGIKRLVIEVKRPGSLVWNRNAVEKALQQAIGYATDQRIGRVGVSDGQMLYAAELIPGGIRDRVFVALDSDEPPVELWWLSVHGIYRPCPAPAIPIALTADPIVTGIQGDASYSDDDDLLHSTYKRPARCFAYVPVPGKPNTWKLPYLLTDGTPDLKRLPKAIQSILSNYRGVNVTIPRDAVPDVLVRLARTAARLGKMPCQSVSAAEAYIQAHEALDQLGRLGEAGCCQ